MNELFTTITNHVALSATSLVLDSQRIAGFSALLLGAFFVLGIGFAGSEMIHNAAHDSRHSLAFACH